MTRTCSALLVALITIGLPARATGPQIGPGADAWVITTDLPPFSLDRARSGTGGAGFEMQFFGEAPNPDNAGADAAYRDRSRGMLVEIGLFKSARTAFLDHLIEANFRDSTTGRMNLTSSMASLFGNAVFAYCYKPADCLERTYMWRSGTNIFLTVEAKAFDAGLDNIPCPEPTEILQAYLQRYPSALTFYTEDDEHAKKWRREQTGLEITSAEFWLDQAASASADRQLGPLESARNHLTSFARLREVAFGGSSARAEEERISKAQLLPSAAQLTELNKIRQEYRQWWNTHQNDPVYLPPK